MNMSRAVGILLLSSVLYVGAQTAFFDTSIFKNKNTWLYTVNIDSIDSGIQKNLSERFTLDSLTHIGDTIRFTLIQEDTGTITKHGGASPLQTTTTTKMVLQNGSFSPTTPFFAMGQTFTAYSDNYYETLDTIVYRGDTLRRERFNGYIAGSCSPSSRQNIEKIGLVQYNREQMCYTPRAQEFYQLISFNGRAYSDSLVTVSTFAKNINLDLNRNSFQMKMIYGGYGIFFRGKDGIMYDVKGKQPNIDRR